MLLEKTICTLLLLSLLAIQCSSPKPILPPAKPNNPNERLEKIKLTDLEGNPVSLKNFVGKPVFLNFWATWCGPCTSEISTIEKASQQLKSDMVFLAASNETPSLIKSYVKKNKLSFQFVRLEGTYLDVYVVALPTTMLIDATGQLVSEESGYRDWSDPDSLEKLKSMVKK